ncbi:regulator of telomere elongation helicase 1-like [Toxotes jaculatrix]|uniref:regulator of telomere elongation helicase 1-like n=1 Tax=Toxotes jaculatrix TaxID=941984 RepID=UPI001B3AF9CA|nr:regulator of telomere elongation helicase 1-like [Toxotes jaculatrix]
MWSMTFLSSSGLQIKWPVVEKKTAAESCGAVCLPDTQPSGFPSCSHSQSPHTQKAKALDAHLPSLKRRRLNEHTGANGIPRIFTQYECEVQKSQRRPANLLETIDHHSGGNGDGVMGEEKVLCFL